MKEKERNAGLKFCKDCKFLLSSENKKTNICIIHPEWKTIIVPEEHYCYCFTVRKDKKYG